MHRVLKHLVICLAICLTATSCLRGIEQPVGIEAAPQLELKGSAGVDIEALVRNDSKRNFTLQSGEIELMSDGHRLLTMRLMKPITVEKQTCELHSTRWKFINKNQLNLLALTNKLNRGDYEGMSTSYSVRIKSGALKRSFSADSIAISEILRTFDIN